MTRILQRLGAARLLPAIALLAAALLPATAGAAIVRDGQPAGDGSAEVFARIRTAIESGNQQALADLVHEDGLRVRTGGAAARDVEYSPSQAFYYFKNLFQARRTVSFVFTRTEQASPGDRVHAMALWSYDHPGRPGDEPDEVRLMLVLGRQGDAWRLIEITTIG